VAYFSFTFGIIKVSAMKQFVFISMVSILAVGCSNNHLEENVQEPIAVSKTVVKGVEAKATAKIGINGMSCEMMCGGAIKKCLKGIKGVKETIIHFDQNETVDVAEVDFDNNQVSEKELIAAIEMLNDGKYKVKSVELVITETSYEKIEKEGENPELKKKPVEVSFFETSRFELPSIFSVAAKIARIR